MRRLILGALAALLSGPAWAVCPSTITDCPFPVFNGITSGANINMLDNKYLVISTDGTKQFGFNNSTNAAVLTNVVLQPNLGVQLPQDQPLILNATSGSNAIAVFDSALQRIRFKNVPVQIDGSLYMPGGNITTSGSLTVANGIAVIGAYTGTTDAALTFTGATFSGGAPAIVLGDNTPLQFSTGATGFAVTANSTANTLAISYNGTTKFAVDSNGNLTIAGQLTAGSAFQGLATFAQGVYISGGGLVMGTNQTLMASSAANAVSGFDLSATTFSVNSFNDGKVSFGGNGDVLLNSGVTLATAATAGFVHFPHTGAAPTGTPINTTPGCAWNTASHVMNCFDGSAWYHSTWTSGAG